jgi:two-component system nitrate/nitrite response regulator NarL
MKGLIASPNAIRVLMVEPHAMISATLQMVLEKHRGIQVIGEARNRTEALAVAGRELPDIVVLDPDLQSDSALAAIPDLLAVSRESRVIVLTGLTDPEVKSRAVLFGAVGWVHKSEPIEVLIKAIEKVHMGEAWLDRFTMASIIGELSHRRNEPDLDSEEAKIASLTDREREVIRLAADGLHNKEIGNRLFISEATAKHHLTSIFSKLDLSSRFELIIFAYRTGIAQPPELSNKAREAVCH